MDKRQRDHRGRGTLARVTFDPRQPFLLGSATRAGLPRRAVKSSTYRRVLPGVYVDARVKVDGRVEALAALLLAGADAFISHHQAARLYGAVVPDTVVMHASIPGNRHRSRRPELTVHRSARVPTRFRGVPVTTPEDTFLDLAGHLTLVDLVVLGDSLVRRGRTTPDRLVAATESAGPRLRRATLRAARLVRHGVDSAMETRSRLLVVLAGLPEPEVNVCFWSPDGQLRRRLDLAYRAVRLALEYDGRQHALSRAQWESDVARREEFDAEDWRIMVLLAKDIYRTPARTLDRLVAAMRKAGMEVPPLSDEWRRHFPGHAAA